MSEVIHLSTYDAGGAGSAAYSMHTKIQSFGITSKFLVANKTREDDSIYQRKKESKLTKKLRKFKQKRMKRFVDQKYLFFGLLDTPNIRTQNWIRSHISHDTKVIIIHWVSNLICYDDILEIYKDTNCKILISLMDMAPFTGGCHYSYGCKNFEQSCISCPATNIRKFQKLIHSNFLMKYDAIRQLDASAIGINKYILNQAQSSSLPFKDYYSLEAPIDQTIFQFNDKYRSGGSHQPKILIGAFNPTDKRKGFNTLVSALHLLEKQLLQNDLRLTIMVLSDTDISPLEAYCYDFYRFEFAKTPEDLAKLYHHADLFVNTSLDDSGPLMISEAIFCGVPFIATNVGITSELVNFNSDLGFSVPILDADTLAETMFKVLFSSPENRLVPSKERANVAREYYSQFESLKQLITRLTH